MSLPLPSERRQGYIRLFIAGCARRESVFPSSLRQRCLVHAGRNMPSAAGRRTAGPSWGASGRHAPCRRRRRRGRGPASSSRGGLGPACRSGGTSRKGISSPPSPSLPPSRRPCAPPTLPGASTHASGGSSGCHTASAPSRTGAAPIAWRPRGTTGRGTAGGSPDTTG